MPGPLAHNFLLSPQNFRARIWRLKKAKKGPFMNMLFNCVLALLALVNPISKIFILSSLAAESDPQEIKRISVKATSVAAGMLIVFALLGNFILQNIFHVKIYAFQIVGGVVLFLRGLQALNKGLFLELEAHQKLEDASIVPLASPMIAGPATLTAAIAFPSQYGMLITLTAIMMALLINLFIMLSAKKISGVLSEYNLMGALIRITGLVVATIGVQMILDGTAEYIAAL